MTNGAGGKRLARVREGSLARAPRLKQAQAISFPASRDRVKGALMVAVPDRNQVSLAPGGWWLVAGGWWLVACGLWLVACGLWLVKGYHLSIKDR